MIIRDIDKYKSIYDKVDALIIVNEENMILYSAMIMMTGLIYLLKTS